MSSLRGEVDSMATKQEVVPGRYGEGVAHEDGGVDNQGACHVSGDAVCPLVTSKYKLMRFV